eukprot:TRINITY_DN28349_c0_g2_i2.p1 TRINITY_DN28349_c0_g2~~TRINITY_DN28349_c0_g2_i2.p1  ORF type:complete len:394 (-),score=67.32 TRINITY_DN28349_c0_g2_i2:239-1420(-)
MIRRPPRSTLSSSSAASDVYKRQEYTDCLVEPTDGSFTMAAEWATDQAVDGYVSVGGGSVIDHAKAANLYATYPADFMEYVNKPLGKARGFGKLRPHIACPTTCGTGSEGTGYAICDIADLGVKTALAGRNLRPDLAVIDPRTVRSLPGSVLASSGFDVLSHAVESFTARRFDSRTVSNPPNARPLNQGANPYSDMGCREALRIIGKYFERALRDPSDHEAREQMHWAATLAGTAMGNAGTALPHGMSYPVSGFVKNNGGFKPANGFEHSSAIIPHGYSVIVTAPAAARFTSYGSPEQHAEAAALLGADTRGCNVRDPVETGQVLSSHMVKMMRTAGDVPLSLGELGITKEHLPELVRGTIFQKRVLDVAPRPVTEEALVDCFTEAIKGYHSY